MWRSQYLASPLFQGAEALQEGQVRGWALLQRLQPAAAGNCVYQTSALFVQHQCQILVLVLHAVPVTPGVYGVGRQYSLSWMSSFLLHAETRTVQVPAVLR